MISKFVIEQRLSFGREVRHEPFGRKLLPLHAICTAGLLFAPTFAAPAQAGTWTVDYYDVEVDNQMASVRGSQGKVQVQHLLPGTGYFAQDYFRREKFTVSRNRESDTNVNLDHVEFTDQWALDIYTDGTPLPPCSGYTKMNVTPHYKWISEPGSTETPPKYIYTCEHATAYLQRDGDGRDGEPYEGEDTPNIYTDDGFGTPTADLGHANPMRGASYSAGIKVDGSFETVHFNRIPSHGQTEVPGPTRVLKVVAGSDGWTRGVGGADAQEFLTYKVTFPGFALKTRRKGSGDSFSDSTTIAASGQGTDEHQAEIRIDCGIPGVALKDLPPVELLSPTDQGNQHPDQGNPRNAVFEGASGDTLTDSLGQVIAGVVRSRDTISTSDPNASFQQGPVLAQLNLGLGYVRPTVPISHIMTGSWHMGENGELDWLSHINILPDENGTFSDYTEPVMFTSAIGSQPIRGHNIKFRPLWVTVNEQDELSGEAVTRTYTSDGAEHAADPTTILVSEEKLSGYVSCTGGTDAGDGKYKGSMTIHAGDTFEVQNVQLLAEDQNVYVP